MNPTTKTTLNLRNFFRLRDNYGRLNIPLIVTLGVITLLIIIIVSAIAIYNQGYHYDKNMTYVDNVSTYASYMDFAAREEMYMALNSAMRENGIQKPPYFGGLIREGTYEQGALAPDQYTSRFIIDVPEVQQSYQAYLVWTGIDSFRAFGHFALLSCVDGSQKIYENFDCKEPTPLNPEQAAKAENYLPYTAYSDEMIATFTVGLSNGNDKEDEETIVMTLWTCGDQDLAKKYEKMGREWLENETMIDLDQYQIKVENACDGAAI